MRALLARAPRPAPRVGSGLAAVILALTGGLVWAGPASPRGEGRARALGLGLLGLVWAILRRHRRRDTQLTARNAALTRANERLAALATTDALTGLPNQRALGTLLEREVDRARRYGRGLAVLVLDLDHFKALNDGHGHAAGDAALREVAAVARGALRAVDVLGRWGGEEFVAIVPESDAADALATAERVRAAVAALPGAGAGRYLTCSIGVAAYPRDSADGAGLMRRADQAMYAAKRRGRDQVCVAGDPAVGAPGTLTPGALSRGEAAVAGTVEALAALVEARDRDTGARGRAGGALAGRLARALGLAAAEARMVGHAGRLHALGTIGLPDAVLRKPGPLSAAEWALVRREVALGAGVVSRVPALRALTPLLAARHERWDGQGYPRGLRGAAIPLGARIVAVADAYVAMTTDRPYRAARDQAWALGEVRRCAGSQFDPRVVEALARVLEEDRVGGVDDRAS